MMNKDQTTEFTKMLRQLADDIDAERCLVHYEWENQPKIVDHLMGGIRYPVEKFRGVRRGIEKIKIVVEYE